MFQHNSELKAARERLHKPHDEWEEQSLEKTLQLQTVFQRLKASEQRLESILNTLQDVVWSAAIEPFQILYLNPAAENLYQHPINAFSANSNLWFEIIHPDDRPEVIESIKAITTRGNIDIEYRILCPNGESRWVRNRSYVVLDEQDKISVRIEGIITDVSDRKRAETQLMYDALHDGLTQLPNRTLFIDRLENALLRKRRASEYSFAVLFLDLDRFKVVNDSLGHIAGDNLLVEVANRLLTSVRPGDTVARLGGDEFTILLDEIADTADVLSCVKRLQAELRRPFEINGSNIFTGASIGIVVATEQYKAAADLLRDADIAMYRAKETRQSGYELFDKVMHAQTVRRLKLENDLHISLERQEFELHYQPIFALHQKTIIGFEALARWHNPEEGLVNPNEFISIAEETGLIVPIGNWILVQACQQLKYWQEQFKTHRHLKLNINVTGQQFRDPTLIDTLEKVLKETNIAGNCLCLEITESTLIQDTEAIIETLKKIRKLDIQISIDDFGTGYSSLSYLTRLPVNNLKIDQLFVSQMHADSDNYEIVRAIASLAHTLRMNVTAEGIETETQLLQLRELNCEFGQGYYFSKPLNPVNAEMFLQQFNLMR